MGAIFYLLEEFPSFQMLQSIILMLALANEQGHTNQWDDVCLFYRDMLPNFIEYGSIPYYRDMFSAIDTYAQYRYYLAVNHRLDVSIPWTAILDLASTSRVIQTSFLASIEP